MCLIWHHQIAFICWACHSYAISEIVNERCFRLPSMDGVEEIVVDKDVVEGRKDPVRVFSKKGKEKAGDAA